jgi:hypothetical protein
MGNRKPTHVVPMDESLRLRSSAADRVGEPRRFRICDARHQGDQFSFTLVCDTAEVVSHSRTELTV